MRRNSGEDNREKKRGFPKISLKVSGRKKSEIALE